MNRNSHFSGTVFGVGTAAASGGLRVKPMEHGTSAPDAGEVVLESVRVEGRGPLLKAAPQKQQAFAC